MKTKLVVFGITGDLSRRKLLPALDQIISTGDFDDLSIIGVSRRQVDVQALITEVLGSSSELSNRMSIFSMDLARADDYDALREHIGLQTDEQLLVYLSVPPNASAQIVGFLGEADLNTPNVKILFEKPFGMDLVSAEEAIARTARYYSEDQIYRIDHFLAKAMAQNIITFRARNAIFGHLWHAKAISRIEVIASEKIGIEGRVQFYEQTGALRDIVQGHLMQLLALTLLDVPAELDWDKLPELRMAALAQIQPANPELAVRAQYESYEMEVANPNSQTETFVSLQLFSQAEHWKDVPLILTTGKALDRKRTEVRIHFKKYSDSQTNCLVLGIQPNEGIEIELYTKKPGYDHQLERQQLSFTYPADVTLPDAYEQVLVDAMRSRKSLFTCSDEVLRSWEILKPVQDAWNMDSQPLKKYANGATIEQVIG